MNKKHLLLLHFIFYFGIIPTRGQEPIISQTQHAQEDLLLESNIQEAYKLLAYKKTQEAVNLLTITLSELPSNKTDSLVALAYNVLGEVYYAEDEYDKAILNFQKALAIRRQLYSNKHEDIVKSHSNIGFSLIYQNKLEIAKDTLLRSLELAAKVPKIDTLIAQINHNLGNIFTIQGDFQQAGIYLDEAIKTYVNLYREDTSKLVNIYESMNGLNIEKSNLSDVIAIAENIILYSENVHKTSQDKREKSTATENLIRNYNDLGIVYELMDSLQLSLDYYEKSLELTPPNNKNPETYTNISILYRKLNNPQQALIMADSAVEIDKLYAPSLGYAESLNSKAMALLAANRLDEANTTIDKALEQFGDTTNILDKKLYIILLRDKMKILQKLAEKTGMIDPLLEAVEITNKVTPLIDDIRQDYQSDISKGFLSSETKSFFEQAIAINWELYKKSNLQIYALNAFEMAERSKSIILLEALLAAQAKKNQQDLDTIFQKEATIRRQITDIELEQALLSSDQKSLAYSELNTELINLNRQLDAQKDLIKEKEPLFYQNLYNTTNYRNINAIKDSIQGDLIEYFVGDSTIYTFVLKKNTAKLSFFQTPLGKIPSMVKDLRTSIDKFPDDLSNRERILSKSTFAQTAPLLYQQLIAHIKDSIDLDTQLIIIPDDVLGYLPFEVLLDKKPSTNESWHSYDYLLYNHQIHYNYSVALMLEMQQKKLRSSTTDFIGFAPSFDNRTEPWVTSLENNETEIIALQNIMGGQVFIDKEATISAFKAAIPTALIIHLATHGKADNKEGNFSSLAFKKSPIAEDNGLLLNRELYDLRLNAEMVVLSACETGLGPLQKGEGIISLARGFSYAGAKSIVTTLWSINDLRTKDIMVLFYKNIKKGLQKDKALWEAKKDFIEENEDGKHPHYWAGIIPIGDMSSIELNNNPFFWYYLSIGGVVFLLSSLLFWYRKKRVNV